MRPAARRAHPVEGVDCRNDPKARRRAHATVARHHQFGLRHCGDERVEHIGRHSIGLVETEHPAAGHRLDERSGCEGGSLVPASQDDARIVGPDQGAGIERGRTVYDDGFHPGRRADFPYEQGLADAVRTFDEYMPRGGQGCGKRVEFVVAADERRPGPRGHVAQRTARSVSSRTMSSGLRPHDSSGTTLLDSASSATATSCSLSSCWTFSNRRIDRSTRTKSIAPRTEAPLRRCGVSRVARVEPHR